MCTRAYTFLPICSAQMQLKRAFFLLDFFLLFLSGEMLGSSWENLHVVWCLQSTEASLSIKPVSFWSMLIYFDLVHAVLWAEMCVVGRHTVCVCARVFLYVFQWLWFYTRDMKAINLGFSHSSADAQNGFQQKEKEKKIQLHAQLQWINLLPISRTKLVLSRYNYLDTEAIPWSLTINCITEFGVQIHFSVFDHYYIVARSL